MSPNTAKPRTTNNTQATMENTSRQGSSHGTKPPVSKREGGRRGSKLKVEPPQIISSGNTKKTGSFNELLESQQTQGYKQSSSLNNLSQKDKKNKSAVRAKENQSKLSGKKKKEEPVKRLHSNDLSTGNQRSDQAACRKCSPSVGKKSGNVLSENSFVNDSEVNKIMPPEKDEESMSLKVPETTPVADLPATTS